MKGMLKSLGLSLLCLPLVTACSYNPLISNNHTTGNPVGAAVGAGVGAGSMAVLNAPKPLIVLGGIGGAMLGYYVTTLRFDSGGVMRSGGQVYRLGDRLGIDIPTDSLFEPNTDTFLPQASAILDSAATVLERYPNNNIIIAGNTSGFGKARWERRLSERRAKQVAAYLWNAGINQFQGPDAGIDHTRKLTYVGYGDFLPIANHYTNTGIRANSHIQITSYPSKEDLGLGKKHLVMQNIGAMKDADISGAPEENPCGDGEANQCFKD